MLPFNSFAANKIVSTITPILNNIQPLILANPVIGRPLNYTIPGYTGPVTSQQWYWNTGSGPVLIPGATGSTYTPSLTSARGGASDVGGFASVAVTTPFGVFRSQEFSATGQVIAQTGVLTKSSPTSGTNFVATEATTVTILTVSVMRLICPNGPNPTFYIETTVAPGTYAGGTSFFGDPTLLGGTQFSSNVYSYTSLAPPACIDQAAAKPATATRPAASTGIGFFAKNGTTYDANGNEFRPRGINRLHWDANRPGSDTGVFNAKANTHRIFIDTSQNWTTVNKPIIDAMVSNSVVPAPVDPYSRANFQGTVSGNVLTVTSMNSGCIGISSVYSSGSGGGLISAGVATTTTISAQLTNTNVNGTPGKEGTYTISNSYTISTPQVFDYHNGTTGISTPELLIAVAQVWCDNYANWAPYERYMVLNIANEWGPAGTASNTVWRDTYITAVGMLRTAGYKCLIRIDAPGSGQDAGASGRGWTLLNHAAAVLAADPQQNITFSLHCYGSYRAGQLAATAAAFNATSGITYDIGEFGPANQNQGPGSITTAQLLETISVAEAYQLGHIDWAWDDPGGATNPIGIYYADCLNAQSNKYSTSDPADLTIKGQQRLLDSVYGLATIAVPATVFP